MLNQQSQIIPGKLAKHYKAQKPCDVLLKTCYIWWVELDFEGECKGSTIFTQH